MFYGVVLCHMVLCRMVLCSVVWCCVMSIGQSSRKDINALTGIVSGSSAKPFSFVIFVAPSRISAGFPLDHS